MHLVATILQILCAWSFYADVDCHGSENNMTLLRKLVTLTFQSQRNIPDRFSDGRRDSLSPRVETTSGPVVGVSTTSSHVFYQIPYAEPPVGKLRWKDPVPIQSQLEEINGTVNTAIQCYQHSAVPYTNVEDCLILNVFVPLTVSFPINVSNSNNLLPVMFYIHGGSFKAGRGTDSSLDGKELARVTNTIVVTINYRLGALGFLTLKEDGEEYIVGNQGLKDQRLALEWVQSNIEHFGGDKNQVTIFGNSAGAQSVMLHVVSPKSQSLFRAAIQQSNPSIYSFYYPTIEAALRISRRLIVALGCNGTATTERECLLDTAASDIIEKASQVEPLTAIAERASVYDEETFIPIVDGEDITDHPMKLFQTGQWNKEKNLIIGVNTEESLDFQFYFPLGTVVDETALRGLITVAYGSEYADEITEKYIQEYPPPEGQDYKITFAHSFSNYYFDCPSRLMARYASETTNRNVFFYTNSHPVLLEYCKNLQGGNTTGCKLAYHASEVRYVFRTLLDSMEIDEDDRKVEDEFSTYWGSFARTESPSQNLETPVGNFPTWPTYTVASTQDAPQSWSHIEISAPTSKVGYAYKEDICDFWDSINYAVTQSTPTATTSSANVEDTTSNGRSMHSLSCLYSPIIIGLCQLLYLMN